MDQTNAAIAAPPDDSHIGRIPKLAFEVVIGALFGLAICFATLRTSIRLRKHRRLFFDDVMLLIACAALITAIVIAYVVVNQLYMSERMILDPRSAMAIAVKPGFAEDVMWLSKLMWVFPTMIWTTLFGVKTCFLLFFRQMVERLPRLLLYWKIVMGITAVAFVVVCPHLQAEDKEIGADKNPVHGRATDELPTSWS